MFEVQPDGPAGDQSNGEEGEWGREEHPDHEHGRDPSDRARHRGDDEDKAQECAKIRQGCFLQVGYMNDKAPQRGSVLVRRAPPESSD